MASRPPLGGYTAYADPAFVRDPGAAIARSEAAFAEWAAGEAAFEAQNGFRRKMNSMHLAATPRRCRAVSGFPLSRPPGRPPGMRSNASTIRFNTVLADSRAQPHVTTYRGEKRAAQLQAHHADGRKAAEMVHFVLNAVPTRAFGLPDPVTRQDGGTVTFVAQDIAWNGRTIARLAADGMLTPLGPDGAPVPRDGNP